MAVSETHSLQKDAMDSEFRMERVHMKTQTDGSRRPQDVAHLRPWPRVSQVHKAADRPRTCKTRGKVPSDENGKRFAIM